MYKYIYVQNARKVICQIHEDVIWLWIPAGSSYKQFTKEELTLRVSSAVLEVQIKYSSETWNRYILFPLIDVCPRDSNFKVKLVLPGGSRRYTLHRDVYGNFHQCDNHLSKFHRQFITIFYKRLLFVHHHSRATALGSAINSRYQKLW